MSLATPQGGRDVKWSGPVRGGLTAPEAAPEAAPPDDSSPLEIVVRRDSSTETPRRRNEWFVRLTLVAADVLAIVAAYLTARWLVPHESAGAFMSVALAVSLPVWIGVLNAARLYDRDNDLIGHSTLDELPALASIVTIGSWLFLLVCTLDDGDARPIGLVAVFWLALLLLLPIARAIARPLFRRSRHYRQNTVIVGAGAVGQVLGRKLLEHPEYNLDLLGFIDDQPKERREDLEQLTVLGAAEDLSTLIQADAIERVMIAFSNDSHEETLQLIRLLKDFKVRIDIVPRLFEVIPSSLTSQAIAGIPLITLPRLSLSAQSRFLKRAFDLVVGLVIAIVLAPLFLAVAILIKLDSSGPVLFRQKRIGAAGVPFVIFKFRTMIRDADDQKHEVAHLNAHAHRGGDPRMFKIADDPRVTRAGKVLRRFSLDEFPQLLNVLRGEMSLVGPRPLILEEDAHVDDWARRRLALKPGMTGLWQVSGRNAIPFEEMVRLDYLYVTTWSLANDIQLMLKTVPLMFRGQRGGHW
jgi:exopolysaccharide biosynthesis polyprenyl glycosylphosphotransferase